MRKLLALCFVLLLSSAILRGQEPGGGPEITAQELRQHVKYLSSDELRGRRTGEPGNKLAAEYIAREFERYGLRPAGDKGTYFQEFPFLASVKEGMGTKLTIRARGHEYKLRTNDEFNLQSVSSDTAVSAGCVFAGYGITADSIPYDDYAGLDVKGKIVIILRYTPDGTKNESNFSKYSPLMTKIFNAREHGAAGILLVTGPADADKPRLIPFEYAESANSGIAVASVRWDVLDSALSLDLRSLQQSLNETKKPHSVPLGASTVELTASIVKEYGTSRNILGVLEGNDPALSKEIVAIGAHMDHLGMGGKGSLAPDTVAIHHGADDNASGTAGLLEVAQYLASRKHDLRRSVLFASFSGEELGLLGSDYYAKHPEYPLDHTDAMLNMDMIGRLTDSLLVVEGMGTSPQWTEIVSKHNSDSLRLKFKPDGFGPSDHSSFYAKDIPVMFFFTNLHSDYHRPSDTWEKINYTGEQKVASLVSRIALDVANLDTKPAFTKAVSPGMAPAGDRQGVRVSLGVIPDYADEAVGMKISGTRPSSAAEKAGLKGGDIIISFGGKAIKNIYDFTYLLSDYKPGDEVAIVVKRGSDEVTLKATLEARK